MRPLPTVVTGGPGGPAAHPVAHGRNAFPALALLLSLAGLFNPGMAGAQILSGDRLFVEPRFGAVFPTGDFGNVDPACAPREVGCDYPTQIGVETGWRWQIMAHYAFTPGWSLAAGFGKANLGCAPNFCGDEADPETRNLSLGVRTMAFPLGTMEIWVEGGAVLEEVVIIRTLDAAGEVVVDRVRYPWSPGVYGGAGASLPLRADRDLFFTPGFRFHYVPADPPDNHRDLRSVDATYVVAEIGVRIVLGR